jgi:hypothetical protein
MLTLLIASVICTAHYMTDGTGDEIQNGPSDNYWHFVQETAWLAGSQHAVSHIR